MLMITTETLPDGCVIREMYPLVWAYRTVQISEKTIMQSVTGLLGKKDSGVQDAFEDLIPSAPEEANAIIGIKVSTASQSFSNGTFLYVTITGTPVTYETLE